MDETSHSFYTVMKCKGCGLRVHIDEVLANVQHQHEEGCTLAADDVSPWEDEPVERHWLVNGEEVSEQTWNASRDNHEKLLRAAGQE